MQTVPRAPSTRVEFAIDTYHGHSIPDPYRWLENSESAETEAWVGEQNAYTRSLLDGFPEREQIQRRLAELLSIGVLTAPRLRNGRYFYMKRKGQQNQPVLYLQDSRTGVERVLLDPNAASEEGTIAIDWWYPSWDGRLLTYGYSANGDEWSTLFVLDVDTGEHLPDSIERTRYASLAWLPDGTGFYYTRYPMPGEAPEGEESYHQRLFFHTLGADPASDDEIGVPNLQPESILTVSVSPDGRYLVVTVFEGWERSDLYLRDLQAPESPFVPIAVGYDALFSAGVADSNLYLHTNLDAPRYRVFQVDVSHPERESWQEIIPETEHVLEAITLAGGRLVGRYLVNATSQLKIFEPDGSLLCDVDLPTLGTVTAVTGDWDELEAFYAFESFTVPPTVYRLPLTGGESTVWAAVEAPLRSEDYTVDQEWYTSNDGTRVSMFLVRRQGLDRTRPHPTVLTGYGGFNVSRTPLFSRSVYLWLEHGGQFALPNLRGGSEYGEEWHRAGMLENKQNVFDDFIAAAEHLIHQGYTDSSQLAIFGGSNGGLLVGAALTQRPELFRAVVCMVPLLDMLRYHRFLLGRLWIPEYGSADDPAQFPFLHAYSPYHHVVEGAPYPAVLLMTAESDTRVDPLHARKMAARLQAANTSGHPILLRVETRAGHGAGKPLVKLIEEQTDFWTFIFWQVSR